MFYARKLREQGICVYLLYMWQLEDVLRAHGFSEEKLREGYLKLFPESECEAELEWLRHQIAMMRDEGVEEKGHTSHNQEVLHQMEDFHYRLLNSGKHPEYSAAYYKALPHIVYLRQHGNADKHEIEVCVEALYCYTLLRMKDKKVSKETLRAVRLITDFLQMLSDAHLRWEKGELVL